MPIQRAKSVGQLYQDCRAYDLVLVPDPPLGSALNRRLEEPHFGPFAITPRRLAAGSREPAEDRTVFLEVIEATGLPWKEAAYVVTNILDCWEHQGEAASILEFDLGDTATTEAVLETVVGLDTTWSRLADHQIAPETEVAVVGRREFTPLETSILPAAVDYIDPFAGETFDRPPFRIFDSAAAIVDTLLDTITTENADRVGIVLDSGSQYSPLIEAALEAADIPFYGGPGFTDHADHRAFLQLLRVAHSGTDLRVGSVRPILERLGADVGIDHDEKRLHAVDLPEVTWLTTFCNHVADNSFAEAIAAFESETGRGLEAFRDEIARLGILTEPVTESAVSQLEFYLQSYDIPQDQDNEGVLLADAKSAGTVDRQAVFYIGMDEAWTHPSPRHPWIDRDAAFTRNLQQFQRLLQNGVVQYYLVLDERGGRAVTPCLYFEELLSEDAEQFADFASERHSTGYQTAGDGFDRNPLDVTAEPAESISQSGLNRLVNCPRDYLFSQLVEGPDKDYFVVGNLFHDFAEVYVNHPDAIGEAAIEAVVDMMVAATRPFDREIDEATNRTRYRIGLETIVEFLDECPPEGAGFLTGSRNWWTNDVADHLDLAVDAPHTEWWFEDTGLGLKGKIDLIHSPTTFLDYKSGRKDSASQIVRKSALDPPHDTPNYQALLYLTYHRSEVEDEPLAFTFFHFLETLDDAITGEADLEDCLTTVRYYPVPFESYITRKSVFETLLEEGAGNCRKTFAQVAHDDIAAVLAAHPFPDTHDSDDLLESPLGTALLSLARDQVGDYAYVETGCRQALRFFRDIRDSTYFADDLDAFEAFVDDRLETLNRYLAGVERFPVEGLGGEPNYRRVDHRDMLFENDA